MLFPPSSTNVSGGTTIFPGPARVPAVKERCLYLSAIFSAGRVSLKAGFDRKEVTSGWLEIWLFASISWGSVGAYTCRVSASVRAIYPCAAIM